MALTVTYPQASLHAQTLMFDNISFNCMYEPMLSVKSEPGVFDERMETSYANSTFTELSTAHFLNIKQGHADWDTQADVESFSSWRLKHPENWETQEVLDWVYYLTDIENLDGALLPGEAYQRLSGKQLCAMTLADFLAIDPSYGSMVHGIFQRLLDGANFKKPSPPELFNPDTLGNSGNVPYFAVLDSSVDSTSSRPASTNTPPADGDLPVFLEQNELKVLIGDHLYDIDSKAFEQIDDSDLSGYGSGSEGETERNNSMSSDVFDLFSDDEESNGLDLPEFERKTKSPSVSSDSGCEGNEEKRTRRRPTSTSKGNHLWEFVRDLLKDPRFNPSLLKWEDKDEGVFKFVQSEAVAQMWGRKKNNPGMTYEKLSRAMRFCRSAGYFDSVPKTGRFPKKLCFKFGQKAHGWQD